MAINIPHGHWQGASAYLPDRRSSNWDHSRWRMSPRRPVMPSTIRKVHGPKIAIILGMNTMLWGAVFSIAWFATHA